MFARRVHIHLKPNSVAEFTQKLETEIIPLLRKQDRFGRAVHDARHAPGGRRCEHRLRATPVDPVEVVLVALPEMRDPGDVIEAVDPLERTLADRAIVDRALHVLDDGVIALPGRDIENAYRIS